MDNGKVHKCRNFHSLLSYINCQSVILKERFRSHGNGSQEKQFITMMDWHFPFDIPSAQIITNHHISLQTIIISWH